MLGPEPSERACLTDSAQPPPQFTSSPPFPSLFSSIIDSLPAFFIRIDPEENEKERERGGEGKGGEGKVGSATRLDAFLEHKG